MVDLRPSVTELLGDIPKVCLDAGDDVQRVLLQAAQTNSYPHLATQWDRMYTALDRLDEAVMVWRKRMRAVQKVYDRRRKVAAKMLALYQERSRGDRHFTVTDGVHFLGGLRRRFAKQIERVGCDPAKFDIFAYENNTY